LHLVNPAEQLWLPQGGSHERAVAKAVESYDRDLGLGQRKDTDEWVVFLKNVRDGDPIPVLGLGLTLPSADRVAEKLAHHDTKRFCGEILRRMENERKAKERLSNEKRDEASGTMAEALEWGFRKMGANPFPKVFVPRSI
jgi:hypothetical protein